MHTNITSNMVSIAAHTLPIMITWSLVRSGVLASSESTQTNQHEHLTLLQTAFKQIADCHFLLKFIYPLSITSHCHM